MWLGNLTEIVAIVRDSVRTFMEKRFTDFTCLLPVVQGNLKTFNEILNSGVQLKQSTLSEERKSLRAFCDLNFDAFPDLEDFKLLGLSKQLQELCGIIEVH